LNREEQPTGTHSGGNPYDFRSPVRHRRLLAGRSDELHELDELLRAAAVGRPVHISLFGGPGAGKSSLLNSVLEIAVERSLLPLKIELRDTTVETEVAFYGAVFEAALQALIDIGALGADGPLMRAWVRQTRGGEMDIPYEDQPFEIGFHLGARTNGKIVGGIPAPSLRRDLQQLVTLGNPFGIRGVVLCIDNAGAIDDNRDIAPSLLELADASALLTLVTAAESAGSLQANAPRAWSQIEVGPFHDDRAVFDAITRPLDGVERPTMWPTPSTATDIYALTEGQPYEVNLVCHYIWEAVHQGEHSDFELSPRVIEGVLRELVEKGRHQASPEIDAVRHLTSAELDILVRVAPYESLTVRQIALLRLMFEDYGDRQLTEKEAEIREELATLEGHGVIQAERDRFEIRGGSDVRLFLRYAAERHVGRRVSYGRSYARQATFACASQLGEAIMGDAHEGARLSARGRPYEVGGLEAGHWVRELSEAVDSGKIAPLSEMTVPRRIEIGAQDESRLSDDLQKGGIFLGLILQVGLHDVEYAELLVNTEELDAAEIKHRAKVWVESTSGLLAKYDVRIVEYHCETLCPDLMTATAVYADLQLMVAIAIILYESGGAPDAVSVLKTSLQRGIELLGDQPSNPIIQSTFADAFNRLGFMTATLGERKTALGYFDKSRTLAADDDWLTDFNRAYLHSCLGNLEEASRLAAVATEAFVPYDGLMFLHAAPPVPKGWAPPSPDWNVVRLHGEWIGRFVALQAAVFQAQAGANGRSRLRALISDLGPSAPSSLLRLAAWSEAMILDRPKDAVALFERAIDAARLADVDVIRAELETVRPSAGAQFDG
jgi:hypothetical protein